MRLLRPITKCGNCTKGVFSVWNPSWTTQKGYIDNKKMFDEM